MAQRRAVKRATPASRPPQPDPQKAEEVASHNVHSVDQPEQQHTDEKQGVARGTTLLAETEPQGEEISDYSELENAPKDGLVLGPDEPLRVEGEEDGSGTGIILSKPVYRAFLPLGSKRWAFLLEYPKGHRLPQSALTPIAKVEAPADGSSDEKDDETEDHE